jgi:hypothetical protein
MEHGFAGEKAANGNAINSPGELVAEPALDAMGVPLQVQAGVRMDELRGNPSTSAPRSWGRASFNDVAKPLVNRYPKSASAEDSP